MSAIDAWARGDFDAAIEAHERIADEYPADIFSVQLCCTHKFYARKDPEGALRIMQSVMPANGILAHAHGFLSFMLEEARRFEEAEASGRKAVQMDRGNVMGQHTVAHVMEAQGRFKERRWSGWNNSPPPGIFSTNRFIHTCGCTLPCSTWKRAVSIAFWRFVTTTYLGATAIYHRRSSTPPMLWPERNLPEPTLDTLAAARGASSRIRRMRRRIRSRFFTFCTFWREQAAT